MTVFTVLGTTDIGIQAAMNACHASGGGTVLMPATNYTLAKSIDQRGMSNIKVKGAGKYATKLTCTSALNGSDANLYNDVFNANNLTIPSGSYPRGLEYEDFTIDCTAQSAVGVPLGTLYGFNLCAIECQNVDAARFRRLQIIRAYGNGIVSGSIDPLFAAAVTGADINDVDFVECCTGGLPQYGGITGSVVQYGAMRGGSIRDSRFMRSGGPAIDIFNCFGTMLSGNWREGVLATAPIGQPVNGIHSDFGLQDCFIEDDVSIMAGPIQLTGLTTPEFFNGMLPTPGPLGCTFRGIRSYGMAAINSGFRHMEVSGCRPGELVLGNTSQNVFNDIRLSQSPGDGLVILDGLDNEIDNLTVDGCGHAGTASRAIALYDSGVSGGGSKRNKISGLKVINGNVLANYVDNTTNCTGNMLYDSLMAATTGGPVYVSTGGVVVRGLY